MLKHTDCKIAPWFIVNADDKKRARLNCIAPAVRPAASLLVISPESTARMRRLYLSA
jgi:Polyphosphate kinase 2 (PPK2)